MGHLSKSETVFEDEIFTVFHIYVELKTHRRILYFHDSSLLTALVQCFDIK